MAGNPLIAQGTLNRLLGSIVWTNFPQLNVTASYLGKEGIRLALEGESTVFLPTMVGAVTSQEPFMMVSLTAHLLKTQPLANAYKQQMESNAQLGDGTVRPDSLALGVYPIVNCAIQSMRELSFSGDDAGFAVSMRGYYWINSNLWNT